MMGWRQRRRMTDRMSSRELESHLSRRGGEGLGSRAWKHVRPARCPPARGRIRPLQLFCSANAGVNGLISESAVLSFWRI